MTALPTDEARTKAVAEPWTDSPRLSNHLRITHADGQAFISVRNVEVAMSPDEAELYAEALYDAAHEARQEVSR
jgi:hypothetical protein